MKIIRNNAIYVQKNDLGFLINSDMPLPSFVVMKHLGGKSFVSVTEENRYDFVKFENEEEIEYFQNLTWLINYDDYENLSEEMIMQEGQDASNELEKIANKYNKMSTEDKHNNKHLIENFNLLEFKVYSLVDIIKLKNGILKIEFPEELGNTGIRK